MLHRCALGEQSGRVRIKTRTPGSSGDTGVDPDAERSSLRAAVGAEGTEVEMRTLDEFALDNVDFIKADCEGYEVFVMHGAVDTLKRCKPAIIVEQKPETGLVARYKIGVTDAVKFLNSLGAQTRKVIQGDYILTWD
jgi:FkbM family methyltransferase